MVWLETKIPPPLVLLLAAVGTWWLKDSVLFEFSEFERSNFRTYIDPGKNLAVALFVLFACVFDLPAIYSFLRAKTTINPMKVSSSSAIITHGVYRLTRNPMYVGLVFWLLAWGVYIEAPICIVFVVSLVLYIQKFQISPEEKALEDKFGDEYLNYKKRVPRWLFF